MTVSYRPSMTDNWHQFRYLFTKTILGKCLLVLFLVTPFVAPIAFYHGLSLHHTSPSHHAAPSPRFYHLMAIVSLIMVATTYAILLFSGLIGLYLGTLLAPDLTITIDSAFFGLKTSRSAKTRWKLISTIEEEAGYFCFVGRMRTFLVPKRAFNSSAEADAFFQMALGYWREAKGIVPPPAPDVSGVWPPAPRTGDFREVDTIL